MSAKKEFGFAGQSEGVVERIVPRPDLRPAISGRRRGPGCGGRPARADAPDKLAQMAAILLAGGVLPGHRLTAVAASQMWVGKEAAVVVGVEERELLMAGTDIKRVGDVQCHAFGRRGIVRQPQIGPLPSRAG